MQPDSRRIRRSTFTLSNLNPIRPGTFDWKEMGIQFLIPFGGVIAALLISALLLGLLGVNPVTAYSAMFSGAAGTTFGLTQSLVKATPLLLVGLGVCIAFRANVINIGGEGQIIAGAIVAAWVPMLFPTWPGLLLIPMTLFAGFLSGGFWGFIPGFLKARFQVNENLTTIMMNSVALYLMNFLLQGPLMDPAGVTAGTFIAQSARVPQQAWLTRLVPRTMLHSGVILAVALAVGVYVFLWRTTMGYRIRAVGLNPHASKYSGINVPFNQAFALTLAGGFAGVAGVIEVLGVQHRLLEGLTSGYGFTGIVAALLGGLHPIGLIPASILFGGLLVGADIMQRAVQVPSALITAVLGLVVLFVAGSAFWTNRLVRKMQMQHQTECDE